MAEREDLRRHGVHFDELEALLEAEGQEIDPARTILKHFSATLAGETPPERNSRNAATLVMLRVYESLVTRRQMCAVLCRIRSYQWEEERAALASPASLLVHF